MRDPSSRADAGSEFAREVSQFVTDAGIEPAQLLKELTRVNPGFGKRPPTEAVAAPLCTQVEAVDEQPLRIRYRPFKTP